MEGRTNKRFETLENKIDDVRTELRDFKSDIRVDLAERYEKWGRQLSEWVTILRTDMENHKIVFFQEMRKESELQQLKFVQRMEEHGEIILKKNREQFNEDMTRHMTALGEEYQWRLAAVGEKVDLTWEKCERKYVELEQKDMVLAEKVALLEEYLPSHPRNHKGTAQSGRKVPKAAKARGISQKSSAENLLLGTKKKNPFLKRNSEDII